MTTTLLSGPADIPEASDTFDLAREYALTAHAVDVYKPGYEYRASEAGWKSATMVSAGAAQLGLCWDDKRVLASVRGTDGELGDFLADGMFWRWPPWGKGPKVAVGFQWQSNALAGAVLDRLAPRAGGLVLMPPLNLPWTIVGHSLGGPVAFDLARKLYGHGIKVESVSAISPARGGNEEWAREIAALPFPTRSLIHVAQRKADPVSRFHLYGHGNRHPGEWPGGTDIVTIDGDDWMVMTGEHARTNFSILRALHPTPWYKPVTRLRGYISGIQRLHGGEAVLASMRAILDKGEA